MVKKKQVKTDENPKEPLTSEETRIIEASKQSQPSQVEQGTLVLKSILEPINRTLEQLIKATNANSAAIKEIVEKPPQPTSIIPPELLQIIKPIAEGVIRFLSAPETPPEQAAKGIFDDTMFEAYKASTIQGFTLNQRMQEQTLKQMELENKLREKRLDEEL